MRVGTNPQPKPSTMVSPDEPLALLGPTKRFVSRAGQKLDGALDDFGLDVSGVRAIDVGASTGGFTDCLLQRGAAHVTAMDVGYGQIHWKLRSDDRVDVIERTNVRTASPEELGAPYDLIVADLSFISLATVSTQLVALGKDDADWVLLIKPQFEAGKDAVGRGGIVKDIAARADAAESAIVALERAGIGCQGLTVSSITGTTGNIEFVGWFRRESRAVSTHQVAEIARGHPT